MRVAILSREFPPAISGIGDHTDRLAAELVRRGHQVAVVCGVEPSPRATFDVRSGYDASNPVATARAVAATKPDVIVWQYNPFSAGPRGIPLRAPRLARALARVAPLVGLFHELWFPWGGGAKGLAWAASQRVQTRRVMRHAARWIVTTELREAELGDRRVRRIPIGTNVLPVAQGDDHEGFVVAHFGNAGSGRDLFPFFSAVERLRASGIPIRLRLIGSAGPLQLPASIVGAVDVTGPISLEDISRQLATSDVFIHADPVGPAVGRRGSLVAALAHGLPLVAYRGPQTAPQLQDGYNVVLVEREERAVTDALRSLATDPARRRSLGRAAKATFDASFSWERIGDRIVAVLEETR